MHLENIFYLSIIDMASHIVINVNGEKRRREFVTGRTPKPKDLKYVQQGLKLPPYLKGFVSKWKRITGKNFAQWVHDEMYKVVSVYTETV